MTVVNLIKSIRRCFHCFHNPDDSVIVENWEYIEGHEKDIIYRQEGKTVLFPAQKVRSNFKVCNKCGIKTYLEPTWKKGKTFV